ncbi:conjugative transposon protein TraM [Flavobacterium chungbukense]|uniref:Conjugative transposon protein TraM n=1 Tax=Flavobacterium chungbukense TaxID=877464 RepID=A0ABP7YUU0_9FLAO|nr:conjugative transposon protein TraM [Flavobacterium chungbukense]MCC4923196.1 conjugative transposon protein TraM [Flavobacterium chungbukense]
MEQKNISMKEDKKRKMLLMLPLITLPFISILFYTLGGGKMSTDAAENKIKKGFNFNLPIPKFKEDSSLNKMSYYDQAAVDSIKLQEQIKKDPNYSNNKLLDQSQSPFAESDVRLKDFLSNGRGLNSEPLQNRNEKKIYEKLHLLQKAISQPSTVDKYEQDMSEFENDGSSNEVSTQIKDLEKMMSTMGESQPDPELQQLSGMLENILDIQHPSRVAEKLLKNSVSKKGKVYNVDSKKASVNITSLQENKAENNFQQNAFYTVEDATNGDSPQNALEAFVHETQTVVNGSIIKLRLGGDAVIQGTVIPKNTFLYGVAALKGERLEIKIENLQYRNSIFPVQLAVYDIDGIEGINIPGAIGRDVAKTSADRSIQTLGLNGVTDSWGAQAAGMGIEAAKSLLSKKVKLIKVIVKAGYQVLLYDEKQKNLKP